MTTTHLIFFYRKFDATEDVVPPEPEAPESIDSLGPDFTIASRRIGWRRGGRMYPLRSYDNAE